MNVRELLTKWGFNIEHDKLNKLERQLEGIKHRMDLFAGVELGKKLFEMSERFGKIGESLHMASESAGIAVEEFQKLALAAGQSGIEQGEMEVSLKRLSRELYAARTGSVEASNALARAGFSAQQVAGFKNSGEALMVLADNFKKIQDPIQKQALAQQILGRGSLHMVGFLSQGSTKIRAMGQDFSRLGAILTGPQVHALVVMEQALKKLWAVISGIGATIAADLSPTLTKLINEFMELVGANRSLISLNLENWLYSVGFAVGIVWGGFKLLVDVLKNVAKHFHMEGEILPTIAKVVALVGFVGTIIALGSSLAVIFNPLSLTIAAIVLLVQELMNLFQGKPGWLTSFGDWISKLEIVDGFLDSIVNTWDKLKSLAGFFNGVGSVGAAGPSVSNNTVGSSSYSVNAPINITVPAGANAGDMGKSVKDGIKEHLDRVYREVRRSTAPVVAY